MGGTTMRRWMEKIWSSPRTRIDTQNLKGQSGEEIRFSVGIDPPSKKVVIIFGRSINTLIMNEDEADTLGLMLIRKSGIVREVKKEEATGGEIAQGQRAGAQEDRTSGLQKEGGASDKERIPGPVDGNVRV